MHILQLVSSTGRNGAVQHAMLLSRELARRGRRVTLVCRDEAWIAEALRNDPVTILHSTMHRWPMDQLHRVASYLRDERVDVLHSHNSRANFFGVLLKWMTGTPSVATANNRYIQLHWMFNSRVIAASQATLDFHCRFNLVRRSRADVVHNFVDVDQIASTAAASREAQRAQLGIGKDDRVLVFVGDVTYKKGVHRLVHAMAEVAGKIPQTKFLIVGGHGDEYSRSLKVFAEEKGIGESLIWYGISKDVPSLLGAGDVFALMSMEETLPMSILEAMAAGLPVVAAPVGGVPECVADGETGVLVSGDDQQALVTALLRFLGDESLRRQMGENGRRKVTEAFGLQRQVDRVESLFAQAIAQDRRGSPIGKRAA